MLAEGRRLAAGLRVPDLDHATWEPRPAGGQAAAVGAERQGRDHAVQPLEDPHLLAGVTVPEPYRGVAADRGELRRAGAEGGGGDAGAVAVQGGDGQPGPGVPEAEESF